MNDQVIAICKLIGAVLSAFGVICTVIPPFRPFLLKVLRLLAVPFRLPWILLDLLDKSDETTRSIKRLHEEVTFEGEGTLSQNVMRLVNQTNFMQRIQARPAIHLDQHGYLKFASYATNRLFKVDSDSELFGGNWHRFMHSSQIDDFTERFRNAAEHSFKFRWTIKLYDRFQTYVGEWTIWGNPIEPKIKGDSLYLCNLEPIDETAKAIAKTHGWSIPTQ